MAGDLTRRIDSARTEDVPRRRYRLVLDLEADTIDALSSALTSIDFEMSHPDGPVTMESTSGGYSSGWHYELTDIGPERTNAEYIKLLTRWRVKRREAIDGR